MNSATLFNKLKNSLIDIFLVSTTSSITRAILKEIAECENSSAVRSDCLLNRAFLSTAIFSGFFLNLMFCKKNYSISDR